MFSRADTFSLTEVEPKRVEVKRLKGAVLVWEHYASLGSTHSYLKGHHDFISDRGRLHRILLDGDHQVEDDLASISSSATETTCDQDQRVLWCVTTDHQFEGVGSYAGSGAGAAPARRVWYDGGPQSQVKLTLLRPLPLELLAPLSPQSVKSLMCVALQIARATDKFLRSRSLWTARGLAMQVKWPNDLVSSADGRKVAGILVDPLPYGCEALAIDQFNCFARVSLLEPPQPARCLEVYVCLSLGLNVAGVPVGLERIAASLADLVGPQIRLADLRQELVCALVEPIIESELAVWARQHDAWAFRGQQIKCFGEDNLCIRTGKLVDVDLAQAEIVLEDGSRLRPRSVARRWDD